MAFITCPSCGRQVSNDLSNCGDCGSALPTAQSAVGQAPASMPYAPPGLWFAVEGGVRKGPLTRAQLDELVLAGRLGATSLVWTDGMTDWQMLGSTLSHRPASVGSPMRSDPSASVGPLLSSATRVSSESAATTEVHQHPKPISRWFARIIDLYAFAFAGGMIATVLGYGELLQTDNNLAFGMALAFFYIPVEAVLMSSLGTTLGKALLGVEVALAGRRQLPFDVAFRRALAVWWSGLGIGFPLVTLFTMAHQREKILKQGATTYDQKAGISVRQRPLSDGQRFLLIVAALVILGLAWFGIVDS